MGLLGRISKKMCKTRDNETVEHHLRQQQRWISQNEEKPRDPECGHVLEIVAVHAPGPIDAVVGVELGGVGVLVNKAFPKVFGTGPSATDFQHAVYRHPALPHDFQNHP